MITAKRLLRKAQRQLASKQQRRKLQNIMDAENDTKTFYKLVKEQRSSTSTSTDTLTIDGKVIDTAEEVTEAWANYFQGLAQPLQDENFSANYYFFLLNLYCRNSVLILGESKTSMNALRILSFSCLTSAQTLEAWWRFLWPTNGPNAWPNMVASTMRPWPRGEL